MSAMTLPQHDYFRHSPRALIALEDAALSGIFTNTQAGAGRAPNPSPRAT